MRLAPGAVIGIFGGGQLGRMTALAAARLGYRSHVFATEADAPAVQVTDRSTIAAYDDPAALEAFGAAVDVVTVEFENLPVRSLERLAAHVPVRPSPAVLRVCQDRLEEKAFLERQDAPTATWRALRAAVDLPEAASFGAPLVLKTARLGYDGKGQLRVEAGAELEAAWTALGRVPSIVETLVEFEREVSVVTARGADGRVASYVPVENRHQNHMLAATIAPAAIDAGLAAAATALAGRLAAALDVVGLLAVEMFVTTDHRLLVNELAPRPHNSGHWTIYACAVSQFEQLVRAVAGLPLGDPERFADATMTNLIGTDIDRWLALMAEPGARLHLYGKSAIRPGRKVGHVTRVRSMR
jgi:5-(carboxyamino)imidazole ribonucleotide synthase